MTLTLDQVTTQLVRIDCAACGLTFAIPDHLEHRLRETHETFYCPKGHTQGYYGRSGPR